MSKTRMRLNLALILVITAFVSLALIAGCTPQQTTEGDTTQDTTFVEGTAFVSDEQCMSCHGGTYESVARLTSDLGVWNPHNPIHGGYNTCVNCHEIDRATTYNYCSQCHVYKPEAEPLFLLDAS